MLEVKAHLNNRSLYQSPIYLGMNPLGLKNAIEKLTCDAGLPVPVVAAITGTKA